MDALVCYAPAGVSSTAKQAVHVVDIVVDYEGVEVDTEIPTSLECATSLFMIVPPSPAQKQIPFQLLYSKVQFITLTGHRFGLSLP